MSHHDDHFPHVLATSAAHPDSLRQARRLGGIALALLLVGGGLRLGLNYRDAQALQQYTDAAAERTVAVVKARRGEALRNLNLPASLRGSEETVIYARSAGYLKAWTKTIGERVDKGQLLAIIDAPEQEQELAQARAVREQIKVRLSLARQTEARWETLRQSDSVAAQDMEEKRSARALAEADLAAASANVKRLEQLESFRRVVAPFAGVVTRRSVEVGNLISAGGKELFAITQTDPLRITVWVPQTYASDIKPGQEVSVKIAEQPGKKFTASIDNVAGAIDPVNRSRQVDLVLPNPDGKLLPGTYVEVGISLSSGVNALIVPANTVVTNADGNRIVTVDAEKRLVFRPVKLGRDLGREIEILDGIQPGDLLVQSPADALVAGEKVSVREIQPKNGGKEKAAGKKGRRGEGQGGEILRSTGGESIFSGWAADRPKRPLAHPPASGCNRSVSRPSAPISLERQLLGSGNANSRPFAAGRAWEKRTFMNVELTGRRSRRRRGPASAACRRSG